MTQLGGAGFVGREVELRALLDALDEAVAGDGQLVLIEGEPGIGKSRLANEVSAVARSGDVAVLWGKGWEEAGAPPYWPWIQVLRTHLRSVDDEALVSQLGAGGADVAQMLPELRERLPDLKQPAEFASDSARFQLFDSVATFLGAAARRRPLLIVVDDLHAADLPSVVFLRFLATQLSEMPVLVIAAYRDLELAPGRPVSGAIADVAREPSTRVLRLTGLTTEALGELVRGATSVPPHPSLLAAIKRATAGNPLFAGETVRQLAAAGHLDEPADLAELRVTVPLGVRAAIARRLDQLDAATIETLELGTTLGPEFDMDLVRRIGDVAPDELSARIDQAAEAGLLLPVPGAFGRYRVAHDLIRETVYEGISSARRARLHMLVAETLERSLDPVPDDRLAELAFHYVRALHGRAELATAVSDAILPKAIEFSRRAGAAAARALAYEEAARLYGMALAVLDIAGPALDREKAETLLATGEVQARSGDLEESRTSFYGAADIARRLGDGPLLARAALGFPGRYPWARPGRERRLIPLLQDALVLLGGGGDGLRVRLLTRLACAWRSSPERRDDSAALSGQALELAADMDVETRNYAITGRYWATWWPENPEIRVALAAEAVATAEEMGDGERIIDARLMVFQSLCERGLLSDARVEMEALSQAIDDLRQPAQLWIEPTNRALLALSLGSLEEAEQLIEREQAVGPRGTPAQDHLIAARMHAFLLRREQGRAAETETGIRESVAEVPWYPFHRAALACLLLDAGRESDARVVFEELALQEFRALYRDNEWLLGMSLASEACARLGEGAAAAILYRDLAPYAGRHAIGHAEGSVGAVDRYLGLLADVLGRQDDAVGHLEDAIRVNDSMGARSWAAHSRHDLANVLRRRDDQGDADWAGQLDRLALEAATRLGMALADRIHDAEPFHADRLPDGPAHISSGTFRREGEYWNVRYGSDTIRVRHSRGMGHLAALLAAPGREIHALDLARDADGGVRAGVRSARALGVDGAAAEPFGDAGPILDSQARAAYRERLTDIREELAEAEAWNDPERVVRLRTEERALAHELAAAVGLGGRGRSAASASERARLSVTRAIRSALARLGNQSPSLGAHLEATIRTGTFCSYVPDPGAPLEWRL